MNAQVWARVALSIAVEAGDEELGLQLAQSNPQETLGWAREQVRKYPQRYRRFAQLNATGFEDRVNRVLAQAEEGQICLLTPGMRDWPTQLKDLGDAAPLVLWARGNPALLRPAALRSLSCVGARAATAYGTYVAEEFSYQLVEQGWCVVSGAAWGIDAAAHRGALAAHQDTTEAAPTIAILACGVDRPYPQAHESLLNSIAQTGLVLSEYPPGATPRRHRFLMRNRLLAALTRGVLVVEAGQRSGALSTARQASDIGRFVGIVPGPITSHQSRGTLAMAREGSATIVTSAAELIEHLTQGQQYAIPAHRRHNHGALARHTQIGAASTPQVPGGAAVLQYLDEYPQSVEVLAQRLKDSPVAVLAVLTQLEYGGQVRRGEQGWTRDDAHTGAVSYPIQ